MVETGKPTGSERELKDQSTLEKDDGKEAKAAPAKGESAQAKEEKKEERSAAAGTGIVNAIADPGFILFIAGLISFFFIEYLGNVALSVTIATIFMFYSAIFIFKAKGLLVTIIFWIWYVLLGGITDPTALLYTLLPIVVIAMLLHGLFTKISPHGSFIDGAGGEFIGLAPVLFFFFDLGLLDFFVKTFDLPISGVTANLLLFFPWWAFLGLFATQKQNFLITTAKLVAIVYIVGILTFGVAPNAYAAAQSTVPGPEEFLKAKQEIREQFPERENPFISQLACIWQGEFANSQACVQRRQEESQHRSICRQEEEENTLAFEECLTKQQELKAAGITAITGTIDPKRGLPTKADFTIDAQFFPKQSFRQKDDITQGQYPVTFKAENPRGQTFAVEFACHFKKASGGATGSVAGEIISEKQIIIAEEAPPGMTALCQPAGPLDGIYQLAMNATLKNLQTSSYLSRVFIGQKDANWKREWIPKIMQAYFPGSQHLSSGPADPARLNFALGNPIQYPIIEGSNNLLLSLSIENTGRGAIQKIHRYALDLEGFAFREYEGCLEKKNIPVPASPGTKVVYHKTCFVTSLPPELQSPATIEPQEFTALLEYDYLISREFPVEVRVVS